MCLVAAAFMVAAATRLARRRRRWRWVRKPGGHLVDCGKFWQGSSGEVEPLGAAPPPPPRQEVELRDGGGKVVGRVIYDD